MEKIEQKTQIFKNYCINNNLWLNSKSLPFFNKSSKKETVIVEFRELPHLYFIIRNTIRVLNSDWSHTIICGTQNQNFINNIVKKINRNIRVIVVPRGNITRMEYSIMLLDSNFYKQFTGDYLLIYQEDSIIFREIPNKYFKFDFVGAPLPNIKNKFNGGFSLRNKKRMIEICEQYYDKLKGNFEKTKNYLEEKKKIIIESGENINDRKFLFLYKIEESLLEDILLCEKCINLPSFEEAREFSVEKYYFNNPVGGHQFWYSLKKVELWLEHNLKR